MNIAYCRLSAAHCTTQRYTVVAKYVPSTLQCLNILPVFTTCRTFLSEKTTISVRSRSIIMQTRCLVPVVHIRTPKHFISSSFVYVSQPNLSVLSNTKPHGKDQTLRTLLVA
ncbi:hypothetical protein P153DRAFT_362811 [Dothidotthia symphoricarpi CBS 119687]|uniref:Uncharacterized protein n=1 Tax=Dothidotthia symphoricarpi CBS 119687 TaxID=1392245 RepID=A0A6A6AP08_9PLEO|nr:uncharacterized protein P153DRAFT_362811 [Dothidotthia symphoricarpi CBS 119687]KAF2133732.1 hypothetical protein P153DRAFT_362811 [Dothidotthia symphoricarpi CBS 119687]